MQIRSLQLFVALARSDSIRQAAQRLALAPTAVARQIDQLEYYFRAELVDRTAGGIRLTEAGSLLAERAQLMVSDLEATRALIDDLRGLRRGQVTIRASGAVIGGLLAPAICEAHALHPQLRFHVDVAAAGEIFAAVAEGAADLGVTLFSPPSDKVTVCQSRQVPHAAIVSPDHVLASLHCVSMEQLARQSLAIPNSAFGVRQNLERVARRSSVRLDPVFVTGSLDMQKELALRGAAVLVLPPLCCSREIASGALVAVPLEAGSTIATSLDLCRAPNRALSFAARALLAILERTMARDLGAAA